MMQSTGNKADLLSTGSLSVSLYALVAFLLPLILYIFTLAPGLLNDDPAEYQTVLPALGVAHPTGYPLYTLVGHLFTRLMLFGDMAYRVNLFSAVCGAAAIVVLYQLMHALQLTPAIALLGAFTLATSHDFWMYATIAQTYALNAFFVAWVLLMFVRYQQREEMRNGRAFVALAFATGLGFAHHSTFWLLSPALLLAWLLTVARGPWRRLPFNGQAKWSSSISDASTATPGANLSPPSAHGPNLMMTYLFAIGAFLLPLLFYLYIPWRGEYWRTTVTGEVFGFPRFVTDGWVTPHFLEGWTTMIVGGSYASKTAEGAPINWLKGMGDYLSGLQAQFRGVEWLVLLGLLPVVWKRNAAFATLLGVAWLTNVFVVLRGVAAFNEPPGGLYTPTYLLGAIVIAWVLDTGTRMFARWDAQRFAQYGVLALLAALCLWNLVMYERGLVPTGDFRSLAQRQLSQVDANAIVIGSWSEITPLRYLQIVEGVRRDVSVVHAPLTSEAVRDLATRSNGRPLYVLQPTGVLQRASTP